MNNLENIIEQYKSWSHDITYGVFSEKNYTNCKFAKQLIQQSKKLFFIGNGGSHAACLHMSEDFCKVANYEAFSLDNPCLITCLGNDYGFENVYSEWLKRYWSPGDCLVAISSSGESKNILNGVNFIKDNFKSDYIITLSAHKPDNSLSQLGNVNFHIPTTNYGAAETYHQLLLHMILDAIVKDKK